MREVGEVDGVDGRVAQLIEERALVEAYSALIRLRPDLAAGFGKLRRKHSEAVKVLADEIGAAAVLVDPAARSR